MKINILSPVMVMGTPVFPTTKTGEKGKEKEVDTVIDIDSKLAKELCLSKQAKQAPKNSTANFEIEALEKEEPDALDEFFGDDDSDDDDDE